MNAEFLQNIANMTFHRTHSDVKLLGDRQVVETVNNQLQHLSLPFS